MSLSTPGVRPAPARLIHGEFFGAAEREVRTASFIFARLTATWSADELPQHSHENGYFLLVLAGAYISGASPDVCGPSTLIFNPPGTTHRDRFQSRTGSFFTVSVGPELTPIISRAFPRPVLLNSALPSAQEAYAELRDPFEPSAFLLEALGHEMVDAAALLSPWQDASAPLWLRRARDWIRDCCTASISVAKVASEVGVHPVHLARAFRQYFGCSPGGYLRCCRINVARRLLRVSDLTLAEVAQAIGYCDQSQFTHVFFRNTGLTPGAYRRQLTASPMFHSHKTCNSSG